MTKDRLLICLIMQYNGSQTVLDIRDDLGATMNECREVTEKYRTGRSAYLRIGMAFVAGGYPLLSASQWQNKLRK